MSEKWKNIIDFLWSPLLLSNSFPPPLSSPLSALVREPFTSLHLPSVQQDIRVRKEDGVSFFFLLFIYSFIFLAVTAGKEEEEGMPLAEVRLVMSANKNSMYGKKLLSLQLIFFFWRRRSVENLGSHSHLQNGSLMGFHSAERAAQGASWSYSLQLIGHCVCFSRVCTIVCLVPSCVLISGSKPVNTGKGATLRRRLLSCVCPF